VRSAAGKQADDARAMADVLTADRRARRPAGAAVATSEPGAPVGVSDVRTSTPEPAVDVVLTRSEVDLALADFAKLTLAIHGSFTTAGVVVDAVSDGTIFQRAGLRSGDVVAAVDGTRLRSLDDAANLYARASSANSLSVQIVRDGKPVALRVVIQ
jgi:S1-C subfamily serine protease